MPVFPSGTPEGFLALIEAQGDGPEATEEFLALHPEIAAATAKIAAAGDPPLSWVNMAFDSLVAYRLVNADGVGQFVRWRLSRKRAKRACLPTSAPRPTTTTS